MAIIGTGLYADFTDFCNHSVPVFAYHRVMDRTDTYSVKPEIFEKHMQYLAKRGYTSISINEFMQKRAEGDDAFYKNFVLTFDDGYEDNNTNAMPIMKKYGYTGTIFVAIKFMGWQGYVTWQDLESLKNNGWEIGSHTYNHVALSQCSAEELDREIKSSKDFLNAFDASYKVNTMAYPFGGYDDKVYASLERNGYIAAVTGVDGVNVYTTPPYQLYRVNVFHDDNNPKMFARRLLWSQLSSWARARGMDITVIRKWLQEMLI